MKVAFESDRAHSDIFEDDDFQFVVEQAGHSKEMHYFVAASIRRYENREQVLHGKQGGQRNMESAANRFLKGRRSRSAGVAVGRKLAAVYGRFDAGRVRGCLIEALVHERLRSRYAHTQLADNVFVTLSNGVQYRTSTSVDVAGYDGSRGECHDCKAQAKRVDADWIKELVDNMVPHDFRIGVATAESARVAAQGMRVPAAVTVTGPDTWWEDLPLQRN